MRNTRTRAISGNLVVKLQSQSRMSPLFGIRTGMLFLLFLLHQANGNPAKCSPMDVSKKEMFEKVFNRDFMGCKFTPRQSMIAMNRLNWMIPSGDQGIVDLARRGGAIFGLFDDIGVDKKGKRMAVAALKVAGVSLGRTGTFTVSTDCITGLRPDFVVALLVSSRNQKEFNRRVRQECKKKGFDIETSARVPTTETREMVRTIICIVGIILSFFFSFITLELVQVAKTVVDSILVMIPCPSTVARAVLDATVERVA